MLILVYNQQDVTLHILVMFGNYSICFVWYYYTTPGANKTVYTVSCICRTVTAFWRSNGWNTLDCVAGGLSRSQNFHIRGR